MILSFSQIVGFIESPANRELIDAARIYSDKCNLHVNGKDINKFFEQIKEYENENQLELRKKYARSNKYLFEEMLRPLDKIFTARGGTKSYFIGGSDDSQEVQFKKILSDVRGGMSLEKWNQEVWLQKRSTDPNGILMLEVSKSGGFCYPTYKGIYSILDYKFSGLRVEYVIFEPEEIEGVKRYRVVDDIMDYIVLETTSTINNVLKKDISISVDESFAHGFNKLPAIMISAKEDEVYGYKTSFIDNTIQVANEILVDNSVKIIFKFTQGFPAYWEIERRCNVCKGQKKIKGVDCPYCNGTGIRQKKDVSDKITVTLDETGKAGAIPPAGYVSADISTWIQMNSESEFMEKILHKAMWGTLALVSEKIYEKATGVISDLQPAYDRLSRISGEAENIEKFFTDLMGIFYFGMAYKGSTVTYGRRFQIESPDQLMEKLTKAKQGGVPWQTIKNIYMEWIQANYENDVFEMTRQIKLLKLDPFPVYTSKELKELLDITDVYKKIFFEQWANKITVDELFFQDITTLETDRDQFISQKIKTDITITKNQEYANL